MRLEMAGDMYRVGLRNRLHKSVGVGSNWIQSQAHSFPEAPGRQPLSYTVLGRILAHERKVHRDSNLIPLRIC